MIAGALLISTVLPPFAEARSFRSPQSYHLRKALLSMDQEKAQVRVRELSPVESKQTYERGIEFFQKLFKRTDTPTWMPPLVHILYAPLSRETWRLEAFRVKVFIKDHHSKNSLELRQLKNYLIALFSSMGISHIVLTQFYIHQLSELFQPHSTPETIAIEIGASIISALVSLFPTQILAHSLINVYRLSMGGKTLTKAAKGHDGDEALTERLRIKIEILDSLELLVKGLSDPIQNMEIHSDYMEGELKKFIGEEMIRYAEKFGEFIQARRLVIGQAGHGKYTDFIKAKYGSQKVKFGQDKIGGYLGQKYYLDSARAEFVYLVKEYSKLNPDLIVNVKISPRSRSHQIHPKFNIGGIAPIIKEWAIKLSNQINLLTHKRIPALSSRNYNWWFASPFENTSAYFVSLLVGLPMYIVTQDFTLSFYASYISTWAYIFIAAHFIPDSQGIRAPPINIGLAGLISVINLTFPYVLPHLFVPAPLVIPSIIFGSYLTHFAVNILANYFKELKLYKESENDLKEFLMIRKLDKHPLSNLTYSLTHKALFRSKVKEEKENYIGSAG